MRIWVISILALVVASVIYLMPDYEYKNGEFAAYESGILPFRNPDLIQRHLNVSGVLSNLEEIRSQKHKEYSFHDFLCSKYQLGVGLSSKDTMMLIIWQKLNPKMLRLDSPIINYLTENRYDKKITLRAIKNHKNNAIHFMDKDAVIVKYEILAYLKAGELFGTDPDSGLLKEFRTKHYPDQIIPIGDILDSELILDILLSEHLGLVWERKDLVALIESNWDAEFLMLSDCISYCDLKSINLLTELDRRHDILSDEERFLMAKHLLNLFLDDGNMTRYSYSQLMADNFCMKTCTAPFWKIISNLHHLLPLLSEDHLSKL